MASATGINIMERAREIGVLRAHRSDPGNDLQAVCRRRDDRKCCRRISGPPAVMASEHGCLAVLRKPDAGEGALLRFAFSPHGFWITLVTTIIFGWLASRIPARKAIRVSTREALAYE